MSKVKTTKISESFLDECADCRRSNVTGVQCEITTCKNQWCTECLQAASKRNEPPKLTFVVMTGGTALLCDKCRADLKANKFGTLIS